MRYELNIRKSELAIDLVGKEYDLPPISLSIHSGGMHYQDYLTVEQAKQLADYFLAISIEVKNA